MIAETIKAVAMSICDVIAENDGIPTRTPDCGPNGCITVRLNCEPLAIQLLFRVQATTVSLGFSPRHTKQTYQALRNWSLDDPESLESIHDTACKLAKISKSSGTKT